MMETFNRRLVASVERTEGGGLQINMEQLGKALEPCDWQQLTDSIQQIFSDTSGRNVGRSTNGRIHSVDWKNKSVDTWRRCWGALGEALRLQGLELEMNDAQVLKEHLGKVTYTPEHKPKLPALAAAAEKPAEPIFDVAAGVLPLVEKNFTYAIGKCADAALEVTAAETELDRARERRDRADAELEGLLAYLEKYKPEVQWRDRATKAIIEARDRPEDEVDEDDEDYAGWDDQ